MATLHINEKQTVENYPYGRLKCTAFFSIEFKKNKGFRHIFQTINPKTGRLNAEKKGNYHSIAFMTNEGGFISQKSMSLQNDGESLNKCAKFLNENFHLFTPEQINYLYTEYLMYIQVDSKAKVIYCGAQFEDIKDFYTDAINLIKKGINEKINVFGEFNIDFQGIKSKCPENYNPFKTTILQPA
jgi:hypothetical protein